MSRRPKIATTNPLTGNETTLFDDYDRQWLIVESPDGSGFGWLIWRLRRKVGHDYDDIGHGFPVVMRKGPFKVLFSGQITRILERGETEIEVWALGWVHVCGNEPFNKVYCDNRWNRWVSSETPNGSFCPDRFDWDTSGRIYLKPRRGVDYDANDYTYVRYTFPFGETAAKIAFDYDVDLPGPWPGKVEVRDSDGNVLWSKTSTDDGTGESHTTTGAPTYFEVRFYCTSAGENTATDDTVFAKLTNVKAYSVTDATLDAAVVAKDIVAELSVAGHGLDSDTGLITSPGRALAPCFFDTDMSCKDVLAWCCQFGDSSDNPLVWGVSYDDEKKLFLRAMDRTTISYVVDHERASLERVGDWKESAQKVYGVYQDDEGQVQRTSDRQDADVITDLGGYYIRRPLQITGTTDETAVLNAVDLWLAENKRPVVSGCFEVYGGVHTPDGRWVPYDEIVPGGLVQIPEWRAVEATLSSDDYRDRKTTFELAGVKVDEDARSAELIPRQSSDVFARYMAIIKELAQ